MRLPLTTKVLCMVAVFAAVLALYWPCRNFAFVRLDDQDYVYQNPHIRGGLSTQCAMWAFTDVGYASNWHPLTWLSHAVDVSFARMMGMDIDRPGRLSGSWTEEEGPLAHLSHAHNILLHAINAALLFWLMATLGGKLEDGWEASDSRVSTLRLVGCALITLLWACHPLRSEVVAWVSERKELLAVMFMLATIILSVKRGVAAYLFSLACFSLALTSKPVAVSLPLVLAALDWTILRRGFRQSVARALPFAVLSGCVCVLTLCAQVDARAVGDATMDWTARICCAVEAPAVYLRQFLWPKALCALYVTPKAARWAYLVGGILMLAGMIWAVTRWLRQRDWTSGMCVFAISWCYLGLVPMLGIVKVGGQPHSDRYTYWIGCGVAVTAALLLWRSVKCIMRMRVERFVLAVFAGWVMICGAATMMRNSVWRNSITLYSDSVAKTHDEESAMILADELCRNGKMGKRAAIAMLKDVLAVRCSPKARGGVAIFMAMFGETVGDIEEARMFALGALEEDEHCGEAYAALGFIEMHAGRRTEAVAHMRKAFENGYVNSRMADLIDGWERGKGQRSP